MTERYRHKPLSDRDRLAAEIAFYGYCIRQQLENVEKTKRLQQAAIRALTALIGEDIDHDQSS